MEQKNIPLVSIGMPTYNGESFIREALRSLLAQDFKDFELIISDNASADNTPKICKEFASRDRRVRYYRNETNIGSNANFNKTLKLARGEYFMWAADDDVWEPSFISDMLDALKKNPEAVLAYSQLDVIALSGKKMYVANMSNMMNVCASGLFRRLFRNCYTKLWGENISFFLYGLIRKDMLLKCGGIAESVDVYKGSDIVALFHLLSYGPFVTVNKLLFHRRDNTPRLAKRAISLRELRTKPLPFQMKYILGWQKGTHQHYIALRKIVRGCSLNIFQKLVLIAVLYASEFRHYARSALVHIV